MNDGGLFVALGAVPGAWLRFWMINHLEPLLPRKHWATLSVNVIAAFALGLVVALEGRCGLGGTKLLLLLATGFLGSFSTFSTLMVEWLQAWQRRTHCEAVLLLVGSVVLGFLAAAAGLRIGSW